MKNTWVSILTAAVVAVGTLDGALAQRGRPTIVPVEAQEVSIEPIVESVRAVGTLRADQSIIVRPEIPGVIVKIGFAESTPVKQGQLLFQLDDTIARAEVQQATAALNLAQRNYDRAIELARTGAGATRARDEAQAAFEANRAALALSRARLEKTTISAPFSGIAGLRKVDLGAYVSAGQDLASLDDIDAVTVEFDVPERYLRFLAPERAIEIEADALPGRVFRGAITALNPRIDPDGRSLAVRARVANPTAELKPGMFTRVRVIVDRRMEAIVIPEQAIVPEGDQMTVFKIVDGKAVVTAISVGMRSFGKVEVVSGLARGDKVITAGQMKVRDGDEVRILEPGPAAGG